MIHRVYIDVQDIINKAAAQSANDFRAMRVKNGKAADEVYDDYVFIADNLEQVLEKIDFVAKVLRTKLFAYLKSLNSTPESIEFEFTMQECRVDESLEAVITDCFVASILNWWYQMRDTDLSLLYAQRASDDADEALHLLTPKFTTRRCRMF